MSDPQQARVEAAPAGWFNSAQSAEDESGIEQLIGAAKYHYCSYDSGAGDDGNPAFALIKVDGDWLAVCAYHAQAAAQGEMERNWRPGDPYSDEGPSDEPV